MRKSTKVVNLIGAPCSGKSLCAGLLFAELKMRRYVVEFVQEYPKTLVWREDFETLRNQLLVSTEQYNMLKCVDGKVDYIVTDGSLLLGLYYNREYNQFNSIELLKTHEAIMSYLNEFDNIYIFLERGDYPYESVGRVHTQSDSLRIHQELKRIMDLMGITYITVKSDKSNLEKMVEYIVSQTEPRVRSEPSITSTKK